MSAARAALLTARFIGSSAFMTVAPARMQDHTRVTPYCYVLPPYVPHLRYVHTPGINHRTDRGGRCEGDHLARILAVPSGSMAADRPLCGAESELRTVVEWMRGMSSYVSVPCAKQAGTGPHGRDSNHAGPSALQVVVAARQLLVEMNAKSWVGDPPEPQTLRGTSHCPFGGETPSPSGGEAPSFRERDTALLGETSSSLGGETPSPSGDESPSLRGRDTVVLGVTPHKHFSLPNGGRLHKRRN